MKIVNHPIFKYLAFILPAWLFLLSPAFSYSKSENTFSYEIDSVKTLLNKYPSDSAKVYTLSLMFRKYRNKNLSQAKHYCNWMFHSYKDSKSDFAAENAYFLKGELLMDEQKYDSAIFCYKKALLYTNNQLKAKCLFRLGTLNDYLGRQDEALGYLKQANQYFIITNSSKNIHGTYDLIIAIYARKGDYDNAIKYIQKKLELDRVSVNIRKLEDDNIYAAYLYEQQNRFNMSIIHLNRALTIAENSSDNGGLIRIYENIADLFFQNNNYRMAIEYYKNGLEKCNGIQYNEDRVNIYNNLSQIYLKEKKDSSAFSYILKSYYLAKKLDDKRYLANVFRNFGHYYKNTGNITLAMKNFTLSNETGKKTPSKLNYYDVLNEIADLYILQANFEKAFAWYNQSLNLAENFNSKSYIAISKFKLGKYYQMIRQSPLAEKYFLESIKVAEESKQPLLVKNIADTLSNFYQGKRNFELAYKYLYLSQKLGDSILKMDGRANLTALEMEHEFENIKKENAIKQALSVAEIKRQKLLRNSMFIISGLLVVLGVIVFINYRKKKRDNQLLVTQKAQIEEKNQEILSQVEEIKAQKDEIERISDKLHQTDQMKLRFFSNISHEIRTPLTLILNPLKNFITSFTGSTEQNRQLDIIHRNAVRLKELSNQILDLQKLDSGNLSLSIENADIVSHIKGIISSFEGYCNKTNCTLKFISQNTSAYCSFDKDKIDKIISNLLSNAFKYNNSGGEVMVRLGVESRQITISIQDTGVGIPKEYISDIFKRYYQLKNSNTPYEGTGVGLAYVKELVELMNGHIDICSEINKGSTFTITIPVPETHVNQTGTCEVELKPEKELANNDPKYNILNEDVEDESAHVILITEDNDDLRNLIGDIFKDEFRVIFAKNGLEGREKAIQNVPDIIISDILMPQMNGLEMCSALKKDTQTSHIPIILLTAKDSIESHIDGYTLGADDYIVKPFDSILLKLKVQNMIETREAIKKQFSFDNLPNKDSYSDIDGDFIKNCISLIKTNMDNSLYSVDTLSEEMAFGRRSFFRKMKALTNMSPYEFIMAYKLKYAAKLLKNGLRVTEVAQSIGFENSKSFSQAFKKHFGVVPSEY